MNSPYEISKIKEVSKEPEAAVIKEFLNNSISDVRDLLNKAWWARQLAKDLTHPSVAKTLLRIANCYESQARDIAKTFDNMFNDYNEFRKELDALFDLNNVSRNISGLGPV